MQIVLHCSRTIISLGAEDESNKENSESIVITPSEKCHCFVSPFLHTDYNSKESSTALASTFTHPITHEKKFVVIVLLASGDKHVLLSVKKRWLCIILQRLLRSARALDEDWYDGGYNEARREPNRLISAIIKGLLAKYYNIADEFPEIEHAVCLPALSKNMGAQSKRSAHSYAILHTRDHIYSWIFWYVWCTCINCDLRYFHFIAPFLFLF